MTHIYLIRHAEAEGNLYRICHGHYNSTLTPQGYRQLRYLRERFADVPVDAVYSSDLLRAHTTASAIYLPHQLPVRLMPQLREIFMGGWEKQSWGDLAHADFENYSHYNKNPRLWRVEGAETLPQAQDRLYDALCRIAGENEGRTVAVASHGAALRMLLGRLQGLSLEEIGQTPYGCNTAVSLVEWDGQDFRVVFRDDVSHLPESELRLVRSVHAATGPGLCWKTERRSDRWEMTPVYQERAAGRLALCLGEDSLSIVDYRIFPEFRGNCLGVQLLGQAIQIARDNGKETIAMHCPAEFDSYFRRWGFTGNGGELTLDIRRIMREIP